ncbi:ATPase [Chitinophaga silvatica]|uniref:ATPase n=1 Tax=Chitinophaga silvatica TaxID=2282649 RepID=A0A3E1YGU8_9BACT|nr:SRPBCC domain-containing protein [Chitinophaga silvatica]RFS26588.1 ATPase [Chitinophaga silvatica]
MEKLEIQCAMQISKPIHEVFESIIDPQKMSGYFISKGSDVMSAGKTIKWQFPEFDDEFNIKVLAIKEDEQVTFQWEGAKGHQTEVNITLSSRPGNATLINLTEGKLDNNAEGIKWLNSNAFGWSNFLSCMKAYLEYNINLRTGAFDYMKK